MQVILTQEVLGLGDPGDVVEVKDGYGRNYLLPQGIAMLASDKNVAALEAERKRIAAAQASEAERVRGEAAQLEGVQVTVAARAGETGKLYGSITNMDLAAALAEMGHDIDRRRILLETPIKQLGEYQVDIKLHPQVVVQIAVTVEAQLDEEQLAKAAAEAAAAAEAEEAGEEAIDETAADDDDAAEAAEDTEEPAAEDEAAEPESDDQD